MTRTIHVVGAGLAGLAAAVRLAGRGASVVVHEAAGQAGGRCRSYHDPALNMVIDNGNHLLLSGNYAALNYLESIGARAGLVGPAAAEFAFVDLASRKRWTLRINAGRLPWWIFHANCRVPGTTASDYLSFVRLLWAAERNTIGETVPCAGPLYERLARPLWLAALNTEPKEASATLAGAVLRETMAVGGRACRPLIAREGLARVFVEPALRFLAAHDVKVAFGHRLRAIEFTQDRIAILDFGEDKLTVADDGVILAVPPLVAADLVPGLETPSQFRAIVNAHFRLVPPAGLAPIIGIVNGTIEWLFTFPDRLSVTISAADRLLEVPRESLAQRIWDEVAAVAGLPKALPPWQIVRERRATFAATPGENAKRPPARTVWKNLVLAGDWTRTGLPATIEGAIRSGHRAADLIGRSPS
ncbi:MAG TPA: hydroxysqualene dehydroxylase HpnE [Xanthobacteraceae bacterium]|jgi:squalene-associated FAD-dependent desaturase